jgi:hypothetical protein
LVQGGDLRAERALNRLPLLAPDALKQRSVVTWKVVPGEIEDSLRPLDCHLSIFAPTGVNPRMEL